jgi:formylglycine-generating enzyme
MRLAAQLKYAEPKMVCIPADFFRMGSESGQDNERPVHCVWVDAFELCAFQVTRADYAAFLAATGHRVPLHWDEADFSHPQQPVVAPSWFDAVAYCRWLSEVTSRHYRLPTEAEWERAARGGLDGQLYPWGDAPPESLPDYAARWKTGPEPVGRYAPNAYGLFNIGDNVHEWCADWFGAYYYSVSPEGNPQGPPEGGRRASRGGSWRHHIKASRCAARSSIPPEFQYADYGFRVACDPD